MACTGHYDCCSDSCSTSTSTCIPARAD
jgi:hypothetical protein